MNLLSEKLSSDQEPAQGHIIQIAQAGLFRSLTNQS